MGCKGLKSKIVRAYRKKKKSLKQSRKIAGAVLSKLKKRRK